MICATTVLKFSCTHMGIEGMECLSCCSVLKLFIQLLLPFFVMILRTKRNASLNLNSEISQALIGYFLLYH